MPGCLIANRHPRPLTSRPKFLMLPDFHSRTRPSTEASRALSNVSCSPDRSLLISCNKCAYTCDVH
jgi:hypothetical protein